MEITGGGVGGGDVAEPVAVGVQGSVLWGALVRGQFPVRQKRLPRLM
ncbi:MAG: hypothetical protein IJV22_01830 [Bacteroidales bacterium]|nr:hypothetical protein [Bacteroidales bacterium]